MIRLKPPFRLHVSLCQPQSTVAVIRYHMYHMRKDDGLVIRSQPPINPYVAVDYFPSHGLAGLPPLFLSVGGNRMT